MFATFKETLTSLRDPNYGQVILTKTVRQSILYWTKYLFLLSALGLLIGLALLAYYVPQSPRLLRDHFPDLNLTLTNSQLTVLPTQPLIYKDKDFTFILNTIGSPSDLDNYPAGILFLHDKYLVKDNRGRIETISYSGLPDFHLDKQSLITWFSQNKPLAFIISLSILVLITFIFTTLSWLLRMASFLVWATLVRFTAFLLKRPLTYRDGLKLILHASVFPLILSPLSHPSISLIGFGIFVYYTFSWLSHLPSMPQPTKINS